MRAVLASPITRRFLAAQLLSLFGDSAMYLALGIWVKALTGSNAAAGLVFFVYLLPTLGSPLAGLLVDRVPRRRLLIVVNLATALVLVPLLLVHDSSDVWVIYLVTLLYGGSGSLVTSAQSALLTVLVPSDDLGGANGVLQTGKELLRLLAPVAGAGLFAWAGGATPVVLLDMATFLVAAALLATIAIDEPAPHPGTGHLRADVLAGIAHVRRTPVLARLVFATGVCTFFFGYFETLIYAIADALHRPPAFIGVLSVAQGVGSVTGGVTAAPMLRRLGELRLGGVGLAVVAAGMAVLPVNTLPAVLGGAAVFGVGIPWLVVGLITALQRLTPPHLQGRVMSAADVVLNVPTTVSIAIGAALVSVVDYRVLILVVVVVTALVSAYLLTTRVSVDDAAVDVDGPLGDGRPAEPLDGPPSPGLPHLAGAPGIGE